MRACAGKTRKSRLKATINSWLSPLALKIERTADTPSLAYCIRAYILVSAISRSKTRLQYAAHAFMFSDTTHLPESFAAINRSQAIHRPC